ncbi:MAG: STAS domain-containing protein [Planctomycetota bacterium]
MSSELHITQQASGDSIIVHLSGKLDGNTIHQLDSQLQRLATSGRNLVIDLSRLSYIASAGVGLFISTQQLLQQHNAQLRLAQPTAMVREIFDILGLDKLFQIHAHLDDVDTGSN